MKGGPRMAPDYVVQGYRPEGPGWEDLTTEKTREAGMVQLRAYRANEPGTAHRLVRRRGNRRVP